jgi:hypothetical protein
MTVYLLHFDRPYVPYPGAPPGACAGHYTGSVRGAGERELSRRLAEHGTERGAKLMLAVANAGIGWRVARTWPGGWARERQLKAQGGAARRCPECGVAPRSGSVVPELQPREPGLSPPPAEAVPEAEAQAVPEAEAELEIIP